MNVEIRTEAVQFPEKNTSMRFSLQCVHFNEDPIYLFLFWELRDLSPNFNIHVSVRDLYISRICPQSWLQQNRQTDPYMNLFTLFKFIS